MVGIGLSFRQHGSIVMGGRQESEIAYIRIPKCFTPDNENINKLYIIDSNIFFVNDLKMKFFTSSYILHYSRKL